MTDISQTGGRAFVVPAELTGTMMLSRGMLVNYVLVRGAVQRFNASTGSTFDPIDVAEALVREGYNITGIAERKVAIKPTPEGLILDKAQVLQILRDDRVAEFPKLELAAQNVGMLTHRDQPMKGSVERIGNGLKMNSFSRDRDDLDARQTLEKFLLDRLMFFEMSYSPVFAALKEAPRSEQEIAAKLVVQQAMFLFDNLDSPDQLVTKSAIRRRDEYIESQQAEERQARQQKQKELFASREAAEGWLMGAARFAYRDAKHNAEYAAQALKENKRAAELIKHHSIDLIAMIKKQIAALGDERSVRREIGWYEGPAAVLLRAFAKPRSIDGSVKEVRRDPADYLLRLVLLWFDAMFVSELPNGAYADVISSEEKYQARYRERTNESLRRDSWSFGRGQSEEYDSFLDDMDRRDEKRADGEMRGYETSRVAMLWWKCPPWIKERILKPYLRTELGDVAVMSKGFTARDFLAHIDTQVEHEQRIIKAQNTLLGTIETDDFATLEKYWKDLIAQKGFTDEVIKAGIEGRAYANDLDEPTRERADATIKASRERVRELEAVRDFVNVEFVMTFAEREAAISQRKSQRSRFEFRSFRW